MPLKTIIRPSYWRNAYLLAGIEEEKDDLYNFRPIDEFWVDIGEIKDKSIGAQKYPILSKLVTRCLCVLPQGNADPERGFSLNKKLLDSHGPSIGEDTIVALRFIKDELILKGGVMKINFTKNMLESCEIHSKGIKLTWKP